MFVLSQQTMLICRWNYITVLAVLTIILHASTFKDSDFDVRMVELEGKDTIITCNMGKLKQPIYYFRWSHNGIPFVSVVMHDCTHRYHDAMDKLQVKIFIHCVDPFEQSLRLKNVSRLANSSIWMCTPFGFNHRALSRPKRVLLNIVVPSSIHVLHTSLLDNNKVTWARVGQEMALNCVSTEGYPRQKVVWYKYFKEVPATESVSEKGGLFTVNATHTFTVSKNDAMAVFECTSLIEYGENSTIWASMQVQLHIESPPESLQISDTNKLENGHDVIMGRHGRELTLECISGRGYPEQSVNWYVGNASDVPLPSTKITTDGSRLFTVKSRYTFTPAAEDNGVMFVCRSSYYTDVLHVSMTTVQLLIARGDEEVRVSKEIKVKADDDAFSDVNETDESSSIIGVTVSAAIVIVALSVALATALRRLCKRKSVTMDRSRLQEISPPSTSTTIMAFTALEETVFDQDSDQYDRIASTLDLPYDVLSEENTELKQLHI